MSGRIAWRVGFEYCLKISTYKSRNEVSENCQGSFSYVHYDKVSKYIADWKAHVVACCLWQITPSYVK